MRISVVMATFNGEKYIKEQMESIRLQTKPPQEVIICDDGSGDHTRDLIADYIATYHLSPSWILIKNEKNLGYGENFRKAADQATGDYIFFADQDDIWHPEKLRIMTGIFRKHPDCTLLCSDYEPFSADGYSFTVPRDIRKKMTGNGKLEHLVLSDNTSYIGALGCCMGFTRELRDQIAPYYFPGWSHDDRFWRLGLCSGGSYLLHRSLTRHRIHDHNTATYGKYHTQDRRVRNYSETMHACEQMLQYLKEIHGTKQQMDLVEKQRKMMKMRIQLIKERKIGNAFLLLGYLRHYKAKKSWLVDLLVMTKTKS